MIFEQSVAVKAANQLNSVVQQINDSQWEMTMPDDFVKRQLEPTTLPRNSQLSRLRRRMDSRHVGRQDNGRSRR